MNSASFGSAVKATLSIGDEHASVFIKVANALNKQRPERAAAMEPLLEEALDKLDAAIEAARPKTLAERYEAFPPELKAKFSFENGRLYFNVVGTGFESKHWPKRLKDGGHELSKWAADFLSKPDYDKKHRLEAGKSYKLALVLGTEIATDAERSTADLKTFACREIGEQATASDLKGELALLIREKFTNAELEEMGLWYIAVLHEPIVDSDGYPRVLYSGRDDGSFVRADYDDPALQWSDLGAFAFLAS